MATKPQFMTIKTHGSRITSTLWQITAHCYLANHVSQERKQPVSRLIGYLSLRTQRALKE